VVGGEAFTFKRNLLRPYARQHLGGNKNKLHAVIASSELAEKFVLAYYRIYKRRLQHTPGHVDK
jgi:hypothetical protein